MNDSVRIQLEIRLEDSVLVILPKAPSINADASVAEFEEALDEMLSTHEQRLILLDLHEVDLIHTSMINALLRIVKRVRADGGQVHACNLKPKVERTFKVTRLDRVFDLYDNEAEGLAAMKQLESRLRALQFS